MKKEYFEGTWQKDRSFSPAVVTGGWESQGYKDFRSLAPALVRGDESEGYAFLLQLVFECYVPH